MSQKRKTSTVDEGEEHERDELIQESDDAAESTQEVKKKNLTVGSSSKGEISFDLGKKKRVTVSKFKGLELYIELTMNY